MAGEAAKHVSPGGKTWSPAASAVAQFADRKRCFSAVVYEGDASKEYQWWMLCAIDSYLLPYSLSSFCFISCLVIRTNEWSPAYDGQDIGYVRPRLGPAGLQTFTDLKVGDSSVDDADTSSFAIQQPA